MPRYRLEGTLMLCRCSFTALILSIGFAAGCSSNGGWCGYNQPQYPIGNYPYQGYPNQVAPAYPGTYAQPGAFGNTTTANSPPMGTMNPGAGVPMTGVPQYSQPLPGGYPMGAYPNTMAPNMNGVPLNQFNPNQPFLGR